MTLGAEHLWNGSPCNFHLWKFLGMGFPLLSLALSAWRGWEVSAACLALHSLLSRARLNRTWLELSLGRLSLPPGLQAEQLSLRAGINDECLGSYEI